MNKILTTSIAALLSAVSSHAATLYWDGAGSNDNWNSLANWGTTGLNSATDPAAIPTTGDEVVFYSTGGLRLLTNNINAPFTVNSITFGNGQTGAVQVNSSGQTLTLDGTANYDPANYNSGASANLGTVGLYVQGGSGAVTLGTASGFVVINAAQNWINNSSTSLVVSSGITYVNALTLNGGAFTLGTAGSGAAGVVIANGTTVINNSTGAIFGTGTVELNGGTYQNSTTGATRTLANALSITGDSTFAAGGAGAANTFTGAVATTGNRALTVNTSTTSFTNTVTLGGNLTVGGSGAFTSSGGINVNGANRTLTFNTGASAVNLSGAINDSVGGGTKLVLSGSGTNVIVGTLNAGANNSPLIEVNGTGIYSFNSTTSTYAGNVILTAGTILVPNNTTGGPPATSGPFGAGTLTLNGGTLRASTNRTIGNTVMVGGGVTIDAAGNPTQNSVTLTGAVALNSGANITYTNAVTSSTHAISGLITLNTSPAVNLNSSAGTGTFATWSGGLDLNNANRSLTVGGTAVRALAISGSLKDTGGTGHNLTINGANNVTASGLITPGAGNPGIIYSGTGIFDVGTTASTWTGGFTLNSGRANLDVSSVVGAGAVTSGPFGTGTVTLNGGHLAEGSTSRTLHNNLVLSGTVTMASTVNPGNTLTFDPTGVTVPAAGSITVNGPVTIMTNHAGTTGLTLTGPITGGTGTPSLTIKGSTFGGGSVSNGIGTVNLVNSGAASTFGNVFVGESVASGSLGGILTASSQNAMGAGAYTINFGGSFSTVTTAFNPTNAITVNNGGTLSLRGAATPGGLVTLNSGSTIAANTGTVTFTSGTNLSVPTTGVLFNNSTAGVTLTNAYPAFTGTMAFGGNGSGSITSSVATTTTGAQTLAFNQTGAGQTIFNGLTLGGSLTIAGSGNNSVLGAVSQGSAASLGVVGGAQALVLSMAPTGAISMSQQTSGVSSVTINRGTLAIDGGNTIGIKAGGTVNLNGGTIRNQNAANNNATWQDAISVGANGGMIETFCTGNAQIVSFSGGITGSTSLTLRYGGSATNPSSLFLAPGSASAYSGSITTTTTNGRGRVQFNANSLAALSSGGVTVGGGILFGVDAYATLTGNIAKFTTSTDSIFALDSLSSAGVSTTLTAVDLSATGINRDLRLGGSATFAGSPTITPFASTFNFTPSGGNITINVDNLITGGARNLDVRAGVVVPGAYNVASGTLSVNNTQNYGGTTTVVGTINNSLVSGTTTGTTLNISGNFTAAGATTVNRGATLQLLGANGKLSGTSGITVHGGGIFQDGDGTAGNNNGVTNRISTAASLTLGGAEGGGTFRMAFPAAANTHAQTLGTLTVNGGISTLGNTGTVAGTLNLAFAGGAGGYVRTAGGRVNLSTATGFNVAFTSLPTGTSIASNGANPILIGATIGADFVAAAAGNWTPATYTAQNTATSWTTASNDGNINTTGAVTGTVPTGTINSLRIAAELGGNITIGTGNTLTIASGMINAATLTSARSITGGSLTSGNGQDLFLMNNSSQTLTIASAITGGLAVLRTGGNTVALTNASNAIGDVYALTGGFLQISTTGALPLATTRTIYIQGGTGAGLLMSAGGTFTSATSINVSPLGGNINTNVNGALTFEGNVTMNGALGIASPSGGSPTALAFSGNFSGPGMLGLGKQSDGKNTIVVSGSNSTWSGGVRMDTTFGNASGGNTHLRFAPSVAGYNSSGTGPIVLASGNNPGGIYFDTTAAGSTTFSNDIVNNMTVAPIVAWGLSTGLGTAGTANTTTLSGSFTGNQGLFLQGYATSDSAISETVLSGTVSVSGAAGGFSYGTATGAQNFNNGQGGITLGVTNFRALTLQGTGNLPLVELPVGTASNGAEGFVRFGGAQSFIPGAVGPGYLSALRKSGTGNDARFGYLLTGTGGAGTSYALPDGKSFVIGSLGAGTRVGGTLGVAGGGTATLLGGESLGGFASGDINVHANGSTDAQELTLFARDTTDRLVIGGVANAVTFSPTTGDSGATSAITLLADRTGTTTLLKRGVGTVDIVNAEFTGIGGTANDDRANVSWQVNEGTLAYNQTDGAVADFAGITVGLSGTLSGSGVIKGDVTSAGTIAPGNSIGTLGVSDLIMSGGSTFAVEVGSITSDSLNVIGTAALSGTGNITLGITLTVDPTDFTNFVLINNDGSDAFGFGANRFSFGGTPLNDGDSFIVTTGAFTQEFQLDYTFNGGGDGQTNDVALLAVPEPGSAALLLGGLALLASRRRRS